MFTTIFTAFSGFFTKNKPTVILAALLLLFAGLFYVEFKETKSLQTQLQYSNQNVQAAKDSITIVRTKDKKEEADKLSFVVSKVSDLQKINDSLATAVKNIKGTVQVITQTSVKIVHDTVPLVVSSTIADSLVKANFKFDTTYSKDNYHAISGYTTYDLRTGKSSGYLTGDTLGMSFVTGIKDLDKGTPTIFITSNYPGFRATSIEGAVLSPSLFAKQKPARRLGIGLSLDYSPLSYNLGSGKFSGINQITLGAGVYYRIW
jgi:hypothetical protein